MKNAFGTELRAARQQAGLTLDQVSRRTHYSMAHLSDFERGERAPPGGEYIVSIATAVGMSPVDLLLAAAADRGEFRCPLSLVPLDELESFLRGRENPPYVCPGCHAVAPDRCVPGCVDDEIESEHRHAIESGDYDETGEANQ